MSQLVAKRGEPSQRALQLQVPRASAVLPVLAGLVVVTIPFDDAVRLGIPYLRNPSAVSGVILLGLFLLVSRGRYVLFSSSQLWAMAFIAVVGLQEVARLLAADAPGFQYTGTPSISTVAALYMAWVQPIVLFLIVTAIAKDRKAMGVILFGLPLVMSGLAIGEVAAAGSGRWAPLGLNENLAGLAFGMSVVISAYWLLYTSTRRSFAAFAVIILSLALSGLGLLLSASRGASGATFVALWVLAFLTPLNPRRALMVGMAMLVLTLGFGSYLSDASGTLLGRWTETVTGGSFGSRDELLSISAELIAESPLWGLGLQANLAIGEQWWGQAGRPFSPHNTFLGLLVSFGVVGAFPWIGMFLSAGLLTWKHRRSATGALLLSLLALFTVYMVTDHAGTNKLLYVTLALTSCLPNCRGTHQPIVRDSGGAVIR